MADLGVGAGGDAPPQLQVDNLREQHDKESCDQINDKENSPSNCMVEDVQSCTTSEHENSEATALTQSDTGDNNATPTQNETTTETQSEMAGSQNCDRGENAGTPDINHEEDGEDLIDGQDREANTEPGDDASFGTGVTVGGGGGGGIGFTLGAESKNEIMDSLAFTLQHAEGAGFPDLDQENIFISIKI